MTWSLFVGSVLLIAVAPPPGGSMAPPPALEAPSAPATERRACTFPGQVDLAYRLTGKRQLPIHGSQKGVCHTVTRDASLNMDGEAGTITIREKGRRPPRGAALATCDEHFRILSADEPRTYHACPGPDDGSIHRARIRSSRTDLPDGLLTVVVCGSQVARVEVDLGLRWLPCSFAWQLETPPADFAACGERLPATTVRRSASDARPFACTDR